MGDVRALTALMLTDMVGYTRLSQQDESRALSLLEEHHQVLRETFLAHGGREVKCTGDGFLVEFPSALQAVTASIAIQRRLHDRNVSVDSPQQFQVRIGLHIGDVVRRDNDIFGDGVNITSRVEPLAEPGGICLSDAVYTQVRNKVDRPMTSLGRRQLKNLEYEIEIFRLELPWESSAVEDKTMPVDLRTRLAVLPLTSGSAASENAYFTDGMTEELIYSLSKVSGLRVIAQTSTMAYRGTSKTAREIGQDLGVGSIIEGSVRRQDDRVRITVQLIDAQTEEHLWSDRYDRRLEDVFDIQSEIAQDVASRLRVLFDDMHYAPDRKPTSDVEAYTVYLKGRHFWQRRTREGLRQAIEAFQQAIEMDPTFAKAYSGLADAYSVMANLGYETPGIALRSAQSAAEKAVALDPDLAEAHASLGLADLQFRHDTAAAQTRFLKALELNPSYASAHQWYSGALYMQLRQEEAVAHALKAVELDPMTPIVHINAANMLLDEGRYEQAKELYERALAIEPDFEGTYADLAKAKAILWDWHGAEQTLATALARNPDNASALAAQGILMLLLGNQDTAAVCMQQARALGGNQFSVIEPLARYHRYLRQTDEALAIYEEASTRWPENPMWKAMMVFTYVEAHDLDQAAAQLREIDLWAVAPHPKLALYIDYGRALILAATGRHAEAIAQGKTIAKADRFVEAASSQIMIHTMLGDVDAAFTHLDRALAVHDPWVPQITVEPLIEPLRSDPRYLRAVEVVGLAQTMR